MSTFSFSRSFFKPFPKQQILDSSKLKEFTDHNFKFNENGRKYSKRVENTVGKGEIAYYKQFFLFPQCFQKIGSNATPGWLSPTWVAKW